MTDPITPLESPQLEQEIRAYVDRLAGRSAAVFSAPVSAVKRATVAKWYADGLRGKHRGVQVGHVAAEIMSHLVDGSDMDGPDFWRSTLGRAVAWHVGYSEDSVPSPIAAAILGMSRQAVHDAKQRGTLAAVRVDGIPSAGVSRGSVRAYLRAQHGVRA